MQGWIKLYRKIQDNDFYFSERFTKAQAWVDLLLLANHKPAKIFIRGVEVSVKRGQLAYSIVSLAGRWKWNKRTAEKFLRWLENQKMCTAEKSNITTIISIQNYSRYQQTAQQSAPQSAQQKREKVHTDKNVFKNEKNVQETTSSDDEVFLTNQFFNITKRTGRQWLKEFPNVKDFRAEIDHVTAVLQEKELRGEIIKSPRAFLRAHLKRVNDPGKRKNGGGV